MCNTYMGIADFSSKDISVKRRGLLQVWHRYGNMIKLTKFPHLIGYILKNTKHYLACWLYSFTHNG